MREKLKRILSNNSGDVSSYIATGLVVIVLMILIVFFVQVAAVFKIHSDLANAANKLMRSAELSGHTNLSSQIDLLKEESGIDFAVDWSGTQYIAGTKKVQLNQDIRLTLSANHTLKVYIFPPQQVTLRVRRTGTSEIYYKG